MRHLSLFSSGLRLLLTTRRRRKRRLAMAMAATVLAASAGGAGPLRTQRLLGAEELPTGDFGDALQQQMTRLLEKCRQSVVHVEAVDAHSPISGTGFFVDANGLLLTCYSIGGETRDIVVKCGDAKYPARRVAADERSGVAILKVEAKTEFLQLGTSYNLPVGAPVMTAGFPMELGLTPSFGVIGGFERKFLGQYFTTTHLRVNIPVQRGEGGAPLLNMRGEVVGMLVSSLDNGSAAFVLPAEAAEKVHRDYVRFGEVRPGWMGFSMQALQAAVNGSTAKVQEVLPESPAEKAGLKPDDVVVQLGARKITCPDDMLDPCFFLSAEDRVELSIIRAGEAKTLHVELIDLPGHHPKKDILNTAATDQMKMGKESARGNPDQ